MHSLPSCFLFRIESITIQLVDLCVKEINEISMLFLKLLGIYYSDFEVHIRCNTWLVWHLNPQNQWYKLTKQRQHILVEFHLSIAFERCIWKWKMNVAKWARTCEKRSFCRETQNNQQTNIKQITNQIEA